MNRLALLLGLLLVPVPAAHAWNDRGHMVVARIAWNQLSVKERAEVVARLGLHPHFEQYLKADRPEGFEQDEWVFLRAATWADWIRSGPAIKYHRGPWHYINRPFTPHGETKAPGAANENIVKQITASARLARSSNREDRAVHLTWVFHLVGDIHQPLHNITLYSAEFPDGDLGGNRAAVRLSGRPIRLHPFWDNLLGASTNSGSIRGAVQEIEALVSKHPEKIEADLRDHTTPEQWSLEGHELGKRLGYLGGKLRPVNGDKKPPEEDIPEAPEGYAETAGQIARYCVAKGGRRLAHVLREIVADEVPPVGR